ncbi:MAG: hypothetical protein FWH57_10525 [Oscillospiraceae bacterium]|nr:hypothetical protein [Oscillospiraceae bacterium]
MNYTFELDRGLTNIYKLSDRDEGPHFSRPCIYIVAPFDKRIIKVWMDAFDFEIEQADNDTLFYKEDIRKFCVSNAAMLRRSSGTVWRMTRIQEPDPRLNGAAIPVVFPNPYSKVILGKLFSNIFMR